MVERWSNRILYVLLCCGLMFEEIARVKQSRNKANILKYLFEKKTPTEVSKALDLSISSTSRSIQRLKKDKLVRCLNPGASSFRLYRITPNGRKLLEVMKKL